MPTRLAAVTETRVTRSQLREVLVGRGYEEAITYSFVDPKLQQLIDPELEADLARRSDAAPDLHHLQRSARPASAAFDQT